MLNDELAEDEAATESSETQDGTAQLLMDCIIMIQVSYKHLLVTI
jgi:hypothetical protein